MCSCETERENAFVCVNVCSSATKTHTDTRAFEERERENDGGEWAGGRRERDRRAEVTKVSNVLELKVVQADTSDAQPASLDVGLAERLLRQYL